MAVNTRPLGGNKFFRGGQKKIVRGGGGGGGGGGTNLRGLGGKYLL